MPAKHKNPIKEVKEKFEDKKKLVDKLIGSLKSKEGESKDSFKKRLLKTSNKKLLKLHEKTQKS